MQTIIKKILPEYFQDIIDGKKEYELRLNDFEIAEGDILILEEWTGGENRKPTGRTQEKIVTYVKRFKIQDLFWSEKEIQEKGIQIIAFK